MKRGRYGWRAIISGGGVRYSGAEKDVADFALKHGIPMAETIAGKGAVTHDHPAHVGPIGVIGSSSANEMAGAADVIIAILSKTDAGRYRDFCVLNQLLTKF